MLSAKNRDTKALLYPWQCMYQCQSNECTGANQLWASVAVCVITYETHSVNTAIYEFELQKVLYTSPARYQRVAIALKILVCNISPMQKCVYVW